MKLASWKYPAILLFGIGIANIGDWIYLIALNLIILDMTGSPLAVAALYILKPVATLFTNLWAGSLIDRLNKRNLMIRLDFFRGVLIAVLPFFSSLGVIYSIVFLINIASSMFEPTAMTYITKFIPADHRKRFNSLRSLIDSGGFLVGPAIAGLLFIIGTPYAAIFINSFSLFVSGLVTIIMPNLEKQIAYETREDLSFRLLKKDWKIVWEFGMQKMAIVFVCLLFSGMIVMMTAIDSLEAAFAKEVLYLSDSVYGFLVSIAGAGIIVGAICTMIFAKKLAIPFLIGIGSVFVSIGYTVYAFSSSFMMAAVGFFILSFSLAFANTGFFTFYQHNIPTDVMGRVGSMIGLIEAMFIIVATTIFGIGAQLASIRMMVELGAFVMLIISGVLLFYAKRGAHS